MVNSPKAQRFEKKPAQEDVWSCALLSSPSATAQLTCGNRLKPRQNQKRTGVREWLATHAGRMTQVLCRDLACRRRARRNGRVDRRGGRRRGGHGRRAWRVRRVRRTWRRTRWRWRWAWKRTRRTVWRQRRGRWVGRRGGHVHHNPRRLGQLHRSAGPHQLLQRRGGHPVNKLTYYVFRGRERARHYGFIIKPVASTRIHESKRDGLDGGNRGTR